MRHAQRHRVSKYIDSLIASAVAQWKRAGLITLMSLDRNQAALLFFCLQYTPTDIYESSSITIKHPLPQRSPPVGSLLKAAVLS